MKWYLAKLVFRIIAGNGEHTPQFDEQIRLISGEDELHAFHKARLLGEGDCITNEMGPPVEVKWKFIDVTELHPLAQCRDGAEIYSVIREEPGADMYIRTIMKSGTQLLQHSLHQFTGKTATIGV